MIKDYSYVEQVQRNAKENILSWDELRIENKANLIINSIKEGIQKKHVYGESNYAFEKCKNRYQEEVKIHGFWDIDHKVYKYLQAYSGLTESICDNIDIYLELRSKFDGSVERKMLWFSNLAYMLDSVPDEIVRNAHLMDLRKKLCN